LSPIMANFGLTIDSPAVYSGIASTGYEAFTRGAETSVTANASMKLDSVTRVLPDNFDTQSTHDAADAFTITQTAAADFSIAMASGYLTEVSYNEGDMMMIDASLKGVTIGSGSLLTIDCA